MANMNNLNKIIILFVSLTFITLSEAQVNYFSSQNISNIQGRVFSDRSASRGQLNVNSHGVGNMESYATLSPVGNFTGFYPNDLNSSQRAVNGNYGSNAVQMEGKEVGIHIHAGSSPNYTNLKTTRAEYKWPYDQKPFPWSPSETGISNPEFCLSFDAAVPVSNNMFNSINYAIAVFHITDTDTNSNFWLINRFYDSRGTFEEGIGAVDPGSQTQMVATYYDGNRYYHSLLPGSRQASGITTSGYGFYGSCISRSQLEEIIDDLNQTNFNVSNDPDNYRINGFNIGGELNMKNSTQHQGHLSMRLKNINVYSR